MASVACRGQADNSALLVWERDARARTVDRFHPPETGTLSGGLPSPGRGPTPSLHSQPSSGWALASGAGPPSADVQLGSTPKSTRSGSAIPFMARHEMQINTFGIICRNFLPTREWAPYHQVWLAHLGGRLLFQTGDPRNPAANEPRVARFPFLKARAVGGSATRVAQAIHHWWRGALSMILGTSRRWVAVCTVVALVATGSIIFRGGPGKLVARSAGAVNGAVSPSTGSPQFVPTTAIGAKSIRNYDQASKLLASARDPGLPGIVAKVNGWPITGKEVAQMEVVLAKPNEAIGASSLRKEAFEFVLDQYVQIQAATKLGLLPSMSWARAQAQSQGILPTTQNLLGIRDTAAMVLYRARVLGSQNASNAAAMTPLIASLVSHATIEMFFHF